MLQEIGYGFKDTGTAAVNCLGKKKGREEIAGGIQIVEDKV